MAQASKIIHVTVFRDGLVALGADGRLWFGVPNYSGVSIMTTWIEMKTPEMASEPIGTKPPDFKRSPELR